MEPDTLTTPQAAIIASTTGGRGAYRFVPTGEFIDLSPEAVSEYFAEAAVADPLAGLDPALAAAVIAAAAHDESLRQALVDALLLAALEVRP